MVSGDRAYQVNLSRELEGKTLFKLSEAGGMLVFEWADGTVTALAMTPEGLYIEHESFRERVLQ